MICTNCGREVNARHWYASGQPRCWKRWWTKARLWKLMEGIERGWDDDRIARELGTTVSAVMLARKRNGVPSRTKTLLSARTAAQRMGVPCAKAVAYWVRSGWLKGRQGPPRGGSRQWLIHPDDLIAFMEDPNHWHRWTPERIPDSGLRSWAIELRTGVRFLSLTEVGRRMFAQPSTVRQWIAKGWLPAVRMGNGAGNHVVRESDLDQFRLPQIGRVRRAA